MVSEFFINLVWVIIKPLIDLMPAIELNVSSESLRFFLDACSAVSYLLPMTDIMIMIGIIVSITMLRVVISFIKTIWELLPLV